MDRRTSMILVVCVVVVIIMGALIGSIQGKLPEQARRAYQDQERLLAQNRDSLQEMESELNRSVGKYPDLLGPYQKTEGWENEVEKAKKSFSDGESIFTQEAQPLYKKNRKDDNVKLLTALRRANTAQASALDAIRNIVARANTLVDNFKNRDAVADRAENDHEAITEMTLGGLLAKVEQAKHDWPQKKDDLEGRMGIFQSYKTQADENISVVREEAAKEPSETNYERFITGVEALATIRSGFGDNASSFSGLTDQLYYSYDIILEDMEIREGEIVEFYHQHKITKIDKDNKVTEQSRWEQVSEALYKKQEKNLGMVLESKPKGKYDIEADKAVSPPGYNYVGNSHYGEWRRDRYGRSSWAFLPLYAFMPALMWGPYYRPIFQSDYNMYRRDRSYGRTYYGRGEGGRRRYGTGGSYTKGRYAYSKYSRNRGYSSSRYKQSGGAYKGSRYGTPSSRKATTKVRRVSTKPKRSTSRSVRGFGRSYGGSRFGGGK